jgi:hypothetical protein
MHERFEQRRTRIADDRIQMMAAKLVALSATLRGLVGKDGSGELLAVAGQAEALARRISSCSGSSPEIMAFLDDLVSACRTIQGMCQTSIRADWDTVGEKHPPSRSGWVS